VQTGDVVLRARALDVSPNQIRTDAFQELITTMIETMRAAPGVGLAAPQIGIPMQVIVLEDREDLLAKLPEADRALRERIPFKTRVFVNPVLRFVGDEKRTFFEGCLSVDGYVALVERSREVEVVGVDEHGAEQTWQVRGWPARILQHEVDHLNGTLYVDRMESRSFSTVANATKFYAGKSIAEVRELLGTNH
ncbi:MAG: peptide deformylase, partial [Polyangiaceae bacterium]